MEASKIRRLEGQKDFSLALHLLFLKMGSDVKRGLRAARARDVKRGSWAVRARDFKGAARNRDFKRGSWAAWAPDFTSPSARRASCSNILSRRHFSETLAIPHLNCSSINPPRDIMFEHSQACCILISMILSSSKSGPRDIFSSHPTVGITDLIGFLCGWDS